MSDQTSETNKQQQVWYVCEDCGCRVPQSGMTKVKTGPDFVFRCAEHLTKVHHREATCMWINEDGIRCPEIFHQSRSGYISEFCPEHRKQKAVKVAQAYRENHSDPEAKALKKLKKSMKLYDPTRLHCVSRDLCLTQYREYLCLPCKGCKNYQLQHGNVDIMDHAHRHGSSEEAAA